MVGFLDCLQQLISYAKNVDKAFKIPFECVPSHGRRGRACALLPRR